MVSNLVMGIRENIDLSFSLMAGIGSAVVVDKNKK